jgi:hypothetical protein
MPKNSAPYRVIQWGTGAVGKYCIQTTIDRPDLIQAGAKVFSDAKVGEDVGVIAHRDRIGVKAVKDKQAILDADADIVLYTPLVVDLDDICDILASGKNLITPSGFFFLKDMETLNRINAACSKGNSTMFATGIHPGFAGDRMALVLSALCRKITKVTIYELVSMADMTESADMVFGLLGFNMDAETAAKTEPPLLKTMSTIFIQCMQTVAAGLGVEIDRFRTSHEYALTTEDSMTTPGLIPKGHVGGQHFNYEAIVGDRTVIECKTYWRMADKLDKDWKYPMTGLNYIVEIEGDPGVRSEMHPLGPRPAEDGLVWTASLVMNAIPEVCKAPAGFKTTIDMPLIAAKFATDF